MLASDAALEELVIDWQIAIEGNAYFNAEKQCYSARLKIFVLFVVDNLLYLLDKICRAPVDAAVFKVYDLTLVYQLFQLFRPLSVNVLKFGVRQKQAVAIWLLAQARVEYIELKDQIKILPGARWNREERFLAFDQVDEPRELFAERNEFFLADQRLAVAAEELRVG